MKSKKKFTFFDKSLLFINIVISVIFFYSLIDSEPTSFWQPYSLAFLALVGNVILTVLWIVRFKPYFLISTISLLIGIVVLFDSFPVEFNKWFSFKADTKQTDFIKSLAVTQAHPRLLMLGGQEKSISPNIANPYWKFLNKTIIDESNRTLSQTTNDKSTIGKRMLKRSRESLKRLIYLSYAWRTTHNERYLAKAKEELLAAASFDDWNPSHFLDVAEMTMGVSIAYDWLYDDLPEMYRITISKAIINKALKPSTDSEYNFWLNKSDNWNQVCNSAMLCGAIVAYQDDPELCKNIINRSIQSLKTGMKSYAPNGNYNEGPGYWRYGTIYNIIAIEALQENFNTDFGLLNQSGLLESSTYFQNMLGSSNAYFNYSDAGEFGNRLSESMFWFADKRKIASLLWNEKDVFNNNKIDLSPNVFLPFAIIWGNGAKLETINSPKQTLWIGNGNNSVASFRTSWTDPNALFIGLKAGSAANNHAHMDAGSFVFDAYGLRWAMDFGAENYGQQESRGIDLWDVSQNSDRWKILKYNNMGHNTLTFDDELQSADAISQIIGHSDNANFKFAVIDLSKTYKKSVTFATRGIAIIDKNYIAIQDEFKGGSGMSQTVKWNMVTPANVVINSNNQASLTQDGKKMVLKVIEPDNVNLTVKPTFIKTAGRKNTFFLSFETDVPSNKNKTILVTIGPSEPNQKVARKPLSHWQ